MNEIIFLIDKHHADKHTFFLNSSFTDDKKIITFYFLRTKSLNNKNSLPF